MLCLSIRLKKINIRSVLNKSSSQWLNPSKYLFEVETIKVLKLVQGGQPNLSASTIKGVKG